MPNDELFSGIPALDDVDALNNYLNQSAAAQLGLGDVSQPPLATPNAAPAQATPEQEQSQTQPQVPQYTSEQIQQIITRNQQLEAAALAAQQAQAQPAPAPAPTVQSAYTPQQIAVIKQALDKGISLDRIQAALNKSNAPAQNPALAQRLQAVEQYLQQQEYARAEAAFTDKMTSFGNKFGLSEQDLVTFGNAAMSKGINLINVSDVEAVFRAIYPEQYAIRSQRMSNAPTSQIFGGSSSSEPPRANASKLEDQYVESFLKHSMPNQYGMNTK